MPRTFTVPVLWDLGEHDRQWETSEEHVAELRGAFERCARLDGALVQGAPHLIEWSRGDKHYEEGGRVGGQCDEQW